MLMATKLGEVKKTPLRNFASVRRDGLIAMDLEASDEFVAAKLASDDDHAILMTARGQALRFAVRSLRSASRLSGGVRGIKLAPGDGVVGMEILRPGEALLVVSALGHGKRTPVEEYPLQGRGGQGVITFKTHAKSGELVAARMVSSAHELMLISEEGIVLRTPVAHISKQGRSTQGVRLMDVGEGDAVAAVAFIDMQREFPEPQALPTGVTVKEDEPRQKKAGKRLESGPMVDQFSFRELIEIHEGQANPAFAARTVSAHLDPPTTTSQGNRVAIFGRGPSRLQRLLGR